MQPLQLSSLKVKDLGLSLKGETYTMTLRLELQSLAQISLGELELLLRCPDLTVELRSAQVPLPLQEEKLALAPVDSSRPQMGRQSERSRHYHIFTDGMTSACERFQLLTMVDVRPYTPADDLYVNFCPACQKVVSKAKVAQET